MLPVRLGKVVNTRSFGRHRRANTPQLLDSAEKAPEPASERQKYRNVLRVRDVPSNVASEYRAVLEIGRVTRAQRRHSKRRGDYGGEHAVGHRWIRSVAVGLGCSWGVTRCVVLSSTVARRSIERDSQCRGRPASSMPMTLVLTFTGFRTFSHI